ncbi:rhomboid family intramembrane serine protease [Niveibacterium sp. SC-1]|uniref:rhomboid family intramembrane serine protease n=1 Tax=Niveibacterium sp. SC-1 TaxID=3135646 RepID=UPI00311FB211
MLILPIPPRPDWRRPPLVTLAILIACCVVFFGWQTDDEARWGTALTQYMESGLAATELPRYVEQLAEHDPGRAEALRKTLDTSRWTEAFGAMEQDAGFMQALRADEIVRPDEHGYATWKTAREEFARLRAQIFSERYGFRTTAPSILTAFTHMFLHGDEGHLFGNMVVFAITGYMVEAFLGGGVFLLFFLAAGLCGAGMDLLLNPLRPGVGIGASGAISGVMAMYVVLFGFSRIRFVGWFLVYVSIFEAPALLVLPLWIAKEAWSMWADHASHVNFSAHLGGFVGGAVLAGLWRLAHRKQATSRPLPGATPPEDPVLAALKRADALTQQLRLDEARGLLARLAQAHPQRADLLQRFYALAKFAPASPEFHTAARLVFHLPENGEHEALVQRVFHEYLNTAKPGVRLDAETLPTLARRLLRAGEIEDGERLLGLLQKRAAAHEATPSLLLLAARQRARKGDHAGCERLVQELLARHGDSTEAQDAQRLRAALAMG